MTDIRDAPAAERVAHYNRMVREAAELVSDIIDAPCLAPQLVPIDQVRANDYNPNRVASPELDLLETSIRDNGVTMPIVTCPEGDDHEVVDGFHRRLVLAERLGATYVPCSLLRRPIDERRASTVQHNRARGKHGVELMGQLVRALMDEGWKDERIAEHLGMSEEELLRLKQVVGAARLMAGEDYSQSWGPV